MKKYSDNDIVITTENDVYRYGDLNENHRKFVIRLASPEEEEEFRNEEEYHRKQNASNEHAMYYHDIE